MCWWIQKLLTTETADHFISGSPIELNLVAVGISGARPEIAIGLPGSRFELQQQLASPLNCPNKITSDRLPAGSITREYRVPIGERSFAGEPFGVKHQAQQQILLCRLPGMTDQPRLVQR